MESPNAIFAKIVAWALCPNVGALPHLTLPSPMSYVSHSTVDIAKLSAYANNKPIKKYFPHQIPPTSVNFRVYDVFLAMQPRSNYNFFFVELVRTCVILYTCLSCIVLTMFE